MNKPGEPKTTYLPFGSDGPPAADARAAEPWLGPQDLYLFNEGSHLRLYDKLGSHPTTVGRRAGLPLRGLGAERGLRLGRRRLQRLGPRPQPASRRSGRRGIWGGFIPGRASRARCYKYHIAAPGGFTAEKTDPFAFTCEIPPKSAAVTWDLSYEWNDARLDGEPQGEERARRADQHLRGAPRLVDARGRPAVPLAQLPRHRPRSSPSTARTWGSPTSSSCRSPSTRSSRRGATRRPATSPRPAATARRRT